jgi:hypothetical protein
LSIILHHLTYMYIYLIIGTVNTWKPWLYFLLEIMYAVICSFLILNLFQWLNATTIALSTPYLDKKLTWNKTRKTWNKTWKNNFEQQRNSK